MLHCKASFTVTIVVAMYGRTVTIGMSGDGGGGGGSVYASNVSLAKVHMRKRGDRGNVGVSGTL